MKFVIIYTTIFDLNNQDKLSKIGGVQRYLYELGLLIKNYYKNDEVVFVQFGSEYIIDEIKGMKVIQLKNIKIKNAINYLKENNVLMGDDILIWGADVLSVKTNIKSISIQHGIACDHFSTNTKIQKISYSNIFTAMLYKALQLFKTYRSFENSDYKVCVDYNFLNWYRTLKIYKNDMDKIFVIPNFTYLPEKRYLECNEKIVISFARRFHHNRGAKLLCEVADELINKYKNIEFLFAGEGEEFNFIKSLENNHPKNVKITKFTSNQSLDYHKKIDIAVIPTIAAEGTSLSLLEAMASSCAVICTNVGGMTNIVLDEFNGLIINPNKQELFEAIEKLILNYDLRKRLSSNAYDSVASSFNIEKWKNSWIQVFQKVIKQ